MSQNNARVISSCCCHPPGGRNSFTLLGFRGSANAGKSNVNHYRSPEACLHNLTPVSGLRLCREEATKSVSCADEFAKLS